MPDRALLTDAFHSARRAARDAAISANVRPHNVLRCFITCTQHAGSRHHLRDFRRLSDSSGHRQRLSRNASCALPAGAMTC
jgi:hypothetical protein